MEQTRSQIQIPRPVEFELPEAERSEQSLVQGVALATNQLLTSGDYATGINLALATLGRVSGVDRVYILEIHPHPQTGETSVSQRFEWAHSSVSTEINNPNLQNLTRDAFDISRWEDALTHGKTSSGLTRELSDIERKLLEPQGILSILIVPIPVSGKLWGFVGFDDCHSERRWSKDEEAVLTTMAANIGGIIALRQTEAALKKAKDELEIRVEERTSELRQANEQLCQEIDKAKHTEQALLEEKFKYRELVQSANSIILRLDTKGKITFFNEFAEKFFGYTQAEILGQNAVGTIVPQKDTFGRDLYATLQNIIHHPEQYKRNENENICRNGQSVWVAWTNKAILDENGELSEILCIGNDITERVKVEARYRAIVEDQTELISRFLPDGTITFVNEAHCRYFGKQRQELIGKSFFPLLCAEDREKVARSLAILNLENPVQTIEHQVVIQGEIRWQQWTNRAIFDDSGNFVEFQSVGRDITHLKQVEAALQQANEALELRVEERTAALREANAQLKIEITERDRAQKALQESEERLRTVVANAPITLWALDAAGIFTFSEGELLEALRLKPGEVVGSSVFKVFSDSPQILENSRRALNGEEFTSRVEINGSAFESWYRPLKNHNAEVTGVIGAAFDITEQLQAEEALRESEEKFFKAFHSSPDTITISTLEDGRYIEVNDNFVRASGYERHEAIGRTAFDLNIWVNVEERNKLKHLLQKQGFVRNLEFEFRSKSGDVLVGSLSAEIIELNGVKCLLAINHDITERKAREVALRESEEKFRCAFRSSPDPMTITTLEESRYIDVNDSFVWSTGYQREEAIGNTSVNLGIWVNLEDRIRFRNLLDNEGVVRNQEYQFYHKSGEVRVALLSAEVIKFDGSKCVLAVSHDITSRKLFEEQLLAAAQRDRFLAEIAERIRRSLNLDEVLNTTVKEIREFLQCDRVYISKINTHSCGEVLAESVNSFWPSILGWKVEDGSHLSIVKTLFEEDRVRVVDDTSEVEVPPTVAEHYRQHQIKATLAVPIMLGEDLFGVLVANQCSSPRQWKQMEIELLEQLATQVAIAIHQAQLYEQEQALTATLDRTVKERTAQLEQAVAELQELNQVKDIFLHAVTHDLRTPVMGWLMVLKNLLNSEVGTRQDLSPSVIANPPSSIPVDRRILERMVQSSDRQLSMINSLLDVHAAEIKGVVLQQEPLQLSQLVNGIVEDFEPLLAKNQAILTNLVPENLPLINADPLQLRRVFENLLSNALNHNPPGLHLILTAKVQEKMMYCTIEDNGVGMSQEVSDRLFELYVRGSHARRSTGIGLGLYLCRQITEAHGGKIGVISSIGAGATFWFTLPLA